jgi:hypothetical protein
MTDPYEDLGVVGIMCTCSKRPILCHVMYPDDETGKSFSIRWDKDQVGWMLEFLREHIEAHHAE